MEKLSTITEMQNVLNRAYKLDLYEILRISDTLFDDIDRLRYLIHKSIPNKIVYKERIVNDRTFYIYRCPICDSDLDANQQHAYCPGCGQRLDWGADE